MKPGRNTLSNSNLFAISLNFLINNEAIVCLLDNVLTKTIFVDGLNGHLSS